MKPIRVFVAASLAVALSGCVLAPGQRLPDSSRWWRLEASRYFNVVPITPQLVATQRPGAVGPATVPAALLDFRPGPYRIEAGDSLYVTVVDHPELTVPGGAQLTGTINSRQVRSDGTLYYPFMGEFKVAGMTPEELRRLITERLAPYIPRPQVDVNIATYASQHVTLSGAFLDTTPQPITSVPLTLAQAIGTAKINVASANLSGLVLSRDGHDYHLDLDALEHGDDLANAIFLKSGDRLFLPFNDRKEVYVMGEVTQPLAIPYKTSAMNLTQALGLAGGLNQVTSNGNAVMVIRGAKDLATKRATVYTLDAKSPVAFALADDFQVRPGDVVFVGAAGVTRWNRVLSQLLPITSLATTAVGIQNTTSKP